jgi:hypothetical protein
VDSCFVLNALLRKKVAENDRPYLHVCRTALAGILAAGDREMKDLNDFMVRNYMESRLTNHQCAAKGCTNTRDQGHFVGRFCSPCDAALVTGEAKNGTSWIFAIAAELAESKARRNSLVGLLDIKEARIGALEAALKRYGSHDFWSCNSMKIQTDGTGRVINDRLPCTCGFDALRATLETSAQSNYAETPLCPCGAFEMDGKILHSAMCATGSETAAEAHARLQLEQGIRSGSVAETKPEFDPAWVCGVCGKRHGPGQCLGAETKAKHTSLDMERATANRGSVTK